MAVHLLSQLRPDDSSRHACVLPVLSSHVQLLGVLAGEVVWQHPSDLGSDWVICAGCSKERGILSRIEQYKAVIREPKRKREFLSVSVLLILIHVHVLV